MAVTPAVNPKKLRPYDRPPKARRSLIPSAPDNGATTFLVLAALWLAAATGIGTLWIATLLFPEQIGLSLEFELPLLGAVGIEVSNATVGVGFASAVVYGWLFNAGLAAILFIVPRLTGARLVSDAAAFAAALFWNMGVAGGLSLVYVPRFAGEGLLTSFSWLMLGPMALALFIVTLLVARSVMDGPRQIPYVSILFFVVALLASLGALTIIAAGSFFGSFFALDETLVALALAFAARLVATFWVLGVALGALFYVVPRATGNPLASVGLALTAWLLWAAFAGLSALGALVDPSVPFFVTTAGNAGTILLVAPVFLAVTALALTIHGRWTLALGTGTIGFALLGMSFLLGTALLEAIGALRSVQGLVRGTEWAFGVWLLAALGGSTFALYALIDHAAPRVLRRDWRAGFVSDVQLWATFAGVTLAGLALVGGGIAHGSLMAEAATPETIDGTLLWFRLVAGGGLGLVALGGLALPVSLFLMYTTARRAEYTVVAEGPTPGGATAGAGAAH